MKTGLLDESLIDAAVARILALKFRLGLFEDPRLPDQERINAVIGSEEHQQLNLEVAREAVALLKNNGSLPFNAAGAKRIAVVGPLPTMRKLSWATGRAAPVRSTGCLTATRAR